MNNHTTHSCGCACQRHGRADIPKADVLLKKIAQCEFICIDINLYLNTQEKGYDDNEYLGIFKDSSAESYHGVMLHCKNPVTVTKGSTSVTIPKGMYFVKSAECGNFVTIAQKIAADEAAADAAHASAEPYTYQYRVDAEWLAENAAYIDVDGVIQNAYVDSDILGGGAGSVQTGFTGGSMQ